MTDRGPLDLDVVLSRNAKRRRGYGELTHGGLLDVDTVRARLAYRQIKLALIGRTLGWSWRLTWLFGRSAFWYIFPRLRYVFRYD